MHDTDGIDMEYTIEDKATSPITITPEWMNRRYAWSLKTFGKGQRTKGIIAHIQCELKEVEAAPDDLMEWVDLLLLALDGAARAGHSSKTVITGIHEKHKINQAREWPRRKGDEEGPIFHAKQEAVMSDELAEAVRHLHEVAYGNVPTVMLAYDNAIANVNKKHIRIILEALSKKPEPMPEGAEEVIIINRDRNPIIWLKNPDNTETALQVEPGRYTGFSLAVALTKAARELGYAGHFTYNSLQNSFIYHHKNKNHGDIEFINTFPFPHNSATTEREFPK